MSDSFDGTGKPHRGSFRGWIIVLIVSLVVIGVLWMLYSEGLNLIPGAAQPT